LDASGGFQIMTSIPSDGMRINSGETSPVLWLICPICKQPNPSGTLHCKYCWGASLYSVLPVTSQELDEIVKRLAVRQRQLNFWRIVLIAVGAPLLLLSAIVFYLYGFTDIIFAPSPDINSSSLPGEWAMFRHDLGRTGAGNISLTDPEGKLKWSYQTGAGILSSPVIVEGVVYFGSRDYNLYAVDAETGQKKWEFRTGSWVESSPAVVDGVVYFGSNDGKFYALDAATGHKLWDFQTRYAIKSSPALANGVVYFGGDDYNVYALDCKIGSKIWVYNTGSNVAASPVVANGILYISSSDGSCYAINADNGRLRLRLNTYEVISGPAFSFGTVYFGGLHHLFAVDGKARNWPGEHTLRSYWLQFYLFYLAPPPPPISGYLWSMKVPTTSHGAPVVVGNTLYAGAYNNLIRVDLSNRKTLWEFRAGDDINSSPALANNRLYVGCDDGQIYAVDAENGEKLWDFATGDKITSSPVYVGGVVYVTSEDGALYAIK
jgi:outer membrane protein assembly factor BamB